MSSGHETMFRLWTLCRGLTVDGCGWLDRSDVLTALESIGLSRAAWYRAIDDPALAIFFTYDETSDRLYLHSLEFVCRAYDCIPGRAVNVPLKRLGRMQTFRAAIYAAQYDAKGRRVKRSTLAEEIGASASSQKRYERIEGLKREKNWVYAPLDDDGNIPDDLPIPDGLLERRANGWDYVKQIDVRSDSGETESMMAIVWQTVNTIRNENRINAPTGMSRRVARKVRRPAEYGGGERPQKYFVRDLKEQTVRGVVALRAGTISIHNGKVLGVGWQHYRGVRN
jgi:hypothetical protein